MFNGPMLDYEGWGTLPVAGGWADQTASWWAFVDYVRTETAYWERKEEGK